MLAAVGVPRQQQNAETGRDHESAADDGFVDVTVPPLAPAEQERACDGGPNGGNLGLQPVGGAESDVGHEDTERSDLGDGEIEEDDASSQHFPTQGHMGGEDGDTHGEGGAENRGIEALPVHCAAPLSRFMSISNQVSRSSAPSAAPTVCGSSITGIPV